MTRILAFSSSRRRSFRGKRQNCGARPATKAVEGLKGTCEKNLYVELFCGAHRAISRLLTHRVVNLGCAAGVEGLLFEKDAWDKGTNRICDP